MISEAINMEDFDKRLYDFRLDDVTNDVKEIKSDMKELAISTNEKYGKMMDLMIQIKQQQCDQVLQGQQVKSTEKVELKKTRSNTLTAIIAAVTSLIIAALTRLL